MLKRHVTFKTDMFDNKEPKPHFINPRCFGEDIACWLLARLNRDRYSLGDPIQEDDGWGFWANVSGERYWTAIGVTDESIGENVAEWVVMVANDPGLNIVRRLFARPKEENLLELCRAIDAALRAEKRIVDIEWWQDQPQMGGSSDHPQGS
ncbi:MAG: hypothetical protein ACRD68_03565 [Pyrinomonadaceae bacterium]